MRPLICLLLLICAVQGEETPHETWAGQVTKAVREGDADRTMVLFDFRALLETATRGGPQSVKTEFAAGAMKAMRRRGGVLHEVIPDVARGGRFDLLRITERDGQPCARFRFASAVGGDPYLGILKANLLLAGGKPDQARESARAALKAGPDWTDGYFVLLDIELQTKRFEEVARLLGMLEDRFEYVFEDLGRHEAYAEFVKSREYRAWLARKERD